METRITRKLTASEKDIPFIYNEWLTQEIELVLPEKVRRIRRWKTKRRALQRWIDGRFYGVVEKVETEENEFEYHFVKQRDLKEGEKKTKAILNIRIVKEEADE